MEFLSFGYGGLVLCYELLVRFIDACRLDS